MFTDNIRTVNMDGISDFERVDAQLRALVAAVIGTIPGSRAFGTEDYLDENTYDVENEFAASLDEGCERYIPEAAIENVTYETRTDGTMVTTIYVERRDED